MQVGYYTNLDCEVKMIKANGRMITHKLLIADKNIFLFQQASSSMVLTLDTYSKMCYHHSPPFKVSIVLMAS